MKSYRSKIRSALPNSIVLSIDKSIFVYRGLITYLYAKNKYKQIQALNPETFDIKDIERKILNFVSKLEHPDSEHSFRYSEDTTEPTLYSSVYACLIFDLLGKSDLKPSERDTWKDLFDSYQCPTSGLFYDPSIQNDIFETCDWWGAKHLALHTIAAYSCLKLKPKYEFHFLEKYYCPNHIDKWINDIDWNSAAIGSTDIDNKIMNIGCLMQYQRDTWNTPSATTAIEELKRLIFSKINKKTGLWGGGNTDNKEDRSRMIQFAYHILPLFFYDNEFNFDAEKIVTTTLKTQNNLGGYGVRLNSSACEDIDSIDILIRFYPYVSKLLQKKIDESLNKSFKWILLNQVNDGGFVFRLHENLEYGHEQMRSTKNKGALFPTWFRLLSITYILRKYRGNFHISRSPGLVY